MTPHATRQGSRSRCWSTATDRSRRSVADTSCSQPLADISHGADAREALAKAAGKRWSELEQAWRSSLPRAPAEHAPRQLARRFRKGEAQSPDESEDVAASAARRFLRLGDLLWSRHHVRGAMLEYGKARQTDPDDPIIGARLARTALQAGDAARALAAVEPLLARYPEHEPTHAVAGAALLALGRDAEARVELLEAVRINPFDPEPHCGLARSDAADRSEQTSCAQLREP